MMDAKLLSNPPIRPLWSLLKLIGNQLALLFGAELAAGQVEGSGKCPLFLVAQAALDDFRALVTKLVGNGLPIITVDYSAPVALPCDQDRNQDAIHADVVPQ